MIKRLGIFTLTIITGFFVFGGVVWGAVEGCPDFISLTVNNKNVVLVLKGVPIEAGNNSADLDYALLTDASSFASGTIQIPIASAASYSRQFDFNGVADGDYKFRVSSRLGICGEQGVTLRGDSLSVEGGLCSFSQGFPAPLGNCTPGLGLFCYEDAAAGTNQGICTKLNPTEPIATYLPDKSPCFPNYGKACDPRLGLSCQVVKEIPPDGTTTYETTYEYACKVDTTSTIPVANFEAFPSQFLNIPQLVNLIIEFSIGVAGVAAFFLLAVGSYKYMLSAGDPKALQSAQQTISSAIAGLVLIILAVSIFGIMSGILQIPGIDLAGDNLNIYTPNIPDSK
jgi:hypothetical protein